MTLYIKNMVCRRCIILIELALKQLGLVAMNMQLGEIVFDQELLPETIDSIKKSLETIWFRGHHG